MIYTMKQNFICVNPNKNPVILKESTASYEQFLHILVQYSWFSRKISAFFLEAYFNVCFHNWIDISREFIQNIQEELAQDACQQSSSINLPHYVLLRKGFQEAFSIDIAHTTPSQATLLFINSTLNLMAKEPALTVGAAYALESSAVPELVMMYNFVKKAFTVIGKPIPNTIIHFFEAHINELEVGHEARLKEVSIATIKTEEEQEFLKKGFLEVLCIMDKWWIELREEMSALHFV